MDIPDLNLQPQAAALLDSSKSSVDGVLRSDRQIAVRWQNRRAEMCHAATVMAVTTVLAHLDLSTNDKMRSYTRKLLPAGHTLIRVNADARRDGQLISRRARCRSSSSHIPGLPLPESEAQVQPLAGYRLKRPKQLGSMQSAGRNRATFLRAWSSWLRSKC